MSANCCLCVPVPQYFQRRVFSLINIPSEIVLVHYLDVSSMSSTLSESMMRPSSSSVFRAQLKRGPVSTFGTGIVF